MIQLMREYTTSYKGWEWNGIPPSTIVDPSKEYVMRENVYIIYIYIYICVRSMIACLRERKHIYVCTSV